MTLHYTGKNIAISLLGEGVNRFLAGEGLESKLAKIAEQMVSELGKGLVLVPDVPIMTVSEILVLRVNKSAAGGGRG